MTSAMKLQLPCPSRSDVPLGPFTTMGVGGRTPLLVEPRNADEMIGALSVLRKEGLAFRMLGGGANLLIDDQGVNEPVILTVNSRYCMREGEDGRTLRVACGLPIPTFVQQTREMGLTGAECLVGIPGTMGGATAMNAGGRHGWLSSIVTRVRILTNDGEDVTLAKNDAMFAYRNSIFSDGRAAVIETVVELAPGNRAAIQEQIKTILKEKSTAQPLTEKSAGCIFKNPPGGSAGKAIEAAGLKGHSIGGAKISTKHGNFIVNTGGATLADIAALVREIRRVVKEHSGIVLEREVKAWTSAPDLLD